MGVSAYVLLGWCRAAEGEGHSATTHRAKPGPGLRSSGVGASPRTFIGRRQTAGGEGGPPFPSGQSPVWAGAPRVWALRPVCCSAGAEQ